MCIADCGNDLADERLDRDRHPEASLQGGNKKGDGAVTVTSHCCDRWAAVQSGLRTISLRLDARASRWTPTGCVPLRCRMSDIQR